MFDNVAVYLSTHKQNYISIALNWMTGGVKWTKPRGNLIYLIMEVLSWTVTPYTMSLSTLKTDDIFIEHGGLPYVLSLAVHLGAHVDRGVHSATLLIFEFFCGTPSSCLKVIGVGVRALQWSTQSPNLKSKDPIEPMQKTPS